MPHYDRNAIALYSENSRIKINQLAQKLKKSPQRLKYTLKQLDKEQITHLPHCVFDYSYFGLILFRVYFKSSFISEKDKKEIISQLNNNQYVVTVYELSGEFDLVIEIESPNPSRVNKELKKLADLIPTLNNYKLILNIVTHIYPRSYLLYNPELIKELERQIIIGGDRNQAVFTNNELTIMKNLLNNPKTRLTQLARISNINVKTATSVLKSLQQRKIIKGFKYVINRNKLNIEKVRLFLKLHNTSKELEDQLMDYLSETKEITQVNKTVGDWDMEIDIESFDRTRIRYLISQIRESFKDLIANFNMVEFYDYYKKSYLPEYIFNPDINTLINP